jgi:hypothetical protein
MITTVSTVLSEAMSKRQILTFICLRATTLSYDVAHRTVRTRSTAFRVDLGTRYVTICVVSRLLQEGVGGSCIQ